MTSTEAIIRKAYELSHLIKESPISIKYETSLSRIASDKLAQDLLARLVIMGKEITEGTHSPDAMGSAEYMMLQRDMEKNPLVREHLLVQREYLSMLKAVMDRIRNPVE